MFRLRGLVVLGVMLAPLLVADQAVAATGCVNGWKAYPLPSGEALSSIDAVSTTDVWAAGNKFNGGGDSRPGIEHFDGVQWLKVRTPVPRAYSYVDLRDIEMASATEGWASGILEPQVGTYRIFLLHWNGVSWRRVRPPSFGDDTDVSVGGISATSTNDAWLVGAARDGLLVSGFAFHWNGRAWRETTLPAQTESWSLSAVTSLGPTDVWAAGSLANGDESSSIAVHWNGSSWTQVATPPPPPPNPDFGDPIILPALAGTSSDLWVIGSIGEYLCCTGSYWLHWDGSSWSTFDAVLGGPTWDAASDGPDLWIVGGWPTEGQVAHFDGSSWSTSAPRASLLPTLSAIAAVGGRAWVVGSVAKPGAPNWALRSC